MAAADERDWRALSRRVRRAASGDEAAFRDLLDAHRALIASTLAACGVRRPETARDLAQEVAVKAWLALPRLRRARTFPAWLRRIAANAARDHLRRAAVRREVALDEATELEDGGGPEERSARRSELELMLAALGEEDAEVVAILVARADGRPIAAMASDAGISEGAMKMRLHRARLRLRKRLAALRGEGA